MNTQIDRAVDVICTFLFSFIMVLKKTFVVNHTSIRNVVVEPGAKRFSESFTLPGLIRANLFRPPDLAGGASLWPRSCVPRGL